MQAVVKMCDEYPIKNDQEYAERRGKLEEDHVFGSTMIRR
jgi:hypothetical protein